MSQYNFSTERFTVTHVHCDRNDERGMLGRDVWIAFHRDIDHPRPSCVVTLMGNWVEWIEVSPEERRQGIATEIIGGLENLVGELELTGVTEEGEKFVDAICGPEVKSAECDPTVIHLAVKR